MQGPIQRFWLRQNDDSWVRVPPIAIVPRWMGHPAGMDGYPVRPHLSRDETAAKMGHPAIFPVRAMGYELCGMRMERPAVYAYTDMRSGGWTIAY
jgi:hypothetical protein